MQIRTTIAAMASLAALTLAAEINERDIPQQCQQVCFPLVSLAAQCEKINRLDSSEVNCICNGAGAKDQLPVCDQCVRQFNGEDDEEEEDDSSTFLPALYAPRVS